MQNEQQNENESGLTLVLTATGKTGRRVADRLEKLGVPARLGSRSAATPFDWDDESTWEPALRGVDAVYVVYTPDLAVPAAPKAIRAFTDLAVRSGVTRLVLLSGRGEEEAQRCERIIQESGVDWTVVRASWFNQNFNEGSFVDLVQQGTIALPAGGTPEPFVDADDIADVVVAALTQDGHAGRIYEVTGPRLMTFVDVASELSKATGREIRFVDISHEDFIAGLKQVGVPGDYIELLSYLFRTVLDGRNASVADGVERAIGRAPKDFGAFASEAAATNIWHAAAQGV